MIRATLDTNVLVSGLVGLHTPVSTPGAIMRRWLDDGFELVISGAILDELERTLRKPFFRERWPAIGLDAELDVLARRATVVVPTIHVGGTATHPEDDLILATAISAGTDYLITGDKQLQQIGRVQHVQVIAPRAFLEILDALS